VETITYALYTPRASGAVTFARDPRDDEREFLIHGETAPYFRKAFGGMFRRKALRHWIRKGYTFEELPA